MVVLDRLLHLQEHLQVMIQLAWDAMILAVGQLFLQPGIRGASLRLIRRHIRRLQTWRSLLVVDSTVLLHDFC